MYTEDNSYILESYRKCCVDLQVLRRKEDKSFINTIFFPCHDFCIVFLETLFFGNAEIPYFRNAFLTRTKK